MYNFKKEFLLLAFFLMFFSCMSVISAAENVNVISDLLQNENVSCTSLSLDNDYVFDGETQVNQTGIVINKEGFEIDGQGHTIDSKGRSRIFVVNAKNVVLKNINFINGNATNGGALLVNENADYLKVYNCKFENNYADIGGAIDCYAKNCEFKKTDFTNNHAKTCSVLSWATTSYDDHSEILECNFINNTADGVGAIWVRSNSGNLQINKCNFEYNTAGLGAAICSQERGFKRVGLCNFNYNHAKEGGAIYATAFGFINKCIFDNNTAEIGGAIRINQSSHITFHLVFNTFTRNAFYEGEEEIYGEAIYSNSNVSTYHDRLDFEKLTFTDNAKLINLNNFTSHVQYMRYMDKELPRRYSSDNRQFPNIDSLEKLTDFT